MIWSSPQLYRQESHRKWLIVRSTLTCRLMVTSPYSLKFEPKFLKSINLGISSPSPKAFFDFFFLIFKILNFFEKIFFFKNKKLKWYPLIWDQIHWYSFNRFWKHLGISFPSPKAFFDFFENFKILKKISKSIYHNR